MPQPSVSLLELLHQYPACNRAGIFSLLQWHDPMFLPCFSLLFTLDPNPDLDCCCFHLSSVNLIWSSLHLASTHKHNPVFKQALPHLWWGYPSCSTTGKGCSPQRAMASAHAAATNNTCSKSSLHFTDSHCCTFFFFLNYLLSKFANMSGLQHNCCWAARCWTRNTPARFAFSDLRKRPLRLLAISITSIICEQPSSP